jgi:Coenzyme PQQ synthesis protein D (PqqD)
VAHNISSQDIYKTTDEVTWRDVNGELVVLRLTSGEYYSFNSIGRLTWMNISEGKSIAEIVETIAAEYDVSHEQAESDVHGFVEGLLTNDLLYKE